MHPLQFHCPHCQSKLRVKDPLSVRRESQCPECRQPILIVEQRGVWQVEAAGTVTAIPETAPQPAPTAAPPEVSPAAVPPPADVQGPARATTPVAAPQRQAVRDSARRKRRESAGLARAFLRNPLAVAWTVAALAACAALGFLMLGDKQSARQPMEVAGGSAGTAAPDATPPASQTVAAPADQASAGAPGEVVSDPPSEVLIPPRDEATGIAPADASAVASSTPQPAPGDQPADPPLEPEFAADQLPPQRVDIPLSMRQKIARYEMSVPRSVADLLPEVSEMLGAPIRFSDADIDSVRPGLKSSVQLRLKETTVGTILETLVERAGLAYRVESDHVQLVPRQ